jgi:antitoxin (DNA-binding transcriptional repressor) of toxin-antitoxin stability system
MAKATIRDLRNHFPKIKAMVEAEGEVIVTDKGEPKYKLMLYTAPQGEKASRAPKDYMSRLRRFQHRPMTPKKVKTLEDENRGER